MITTTTSSTLINQPNPELKAIVQRLFDDALMTWGKKFSDQWGAIKLSALTDHWTIELAGYTRREIKRGADAQKLSDWPPTLPAFKKMCRPPVDYGLAYHEAMIGLSDRERGEMGAWSHPAIYWAARTLSYDMKSQSAEQMKSRWRAVLDQKIAIGRWDEIHMPMPALPAPGRGELSKESAAAMLEQLSASGLLRRKHDANEWAEALLARAAAGDKTITITARKFAQEAINRKKATE